MGRLVLTGHCIEKMKARGITLSEIEECCWHPQVSYGSNGHEIRQRGLIACAVVVRGSNVIVRTVLLREASWWDDNDARARQEAR